MTSARAHIAAVTALLAGCASVDAIPPTRETEKPSVTELASTQNAEPAPVGDTDKPILVDGKRVADGDLVPMPALELACLPAANALTAPLEASALFMTTAEKLLLPVGRLAFVVLERDPARSITDPPPHLCRTIPMGFYVKAPLRRANEPPSRWLVRRIATGLVDDAAALIATSEERNYVAAAPPRVLVDETGALVAIALPVSASKGGS